MSDIIVSDETVDETGNRLERIRTLAHNVSDVATVVTAVVIVYGFVKNRLDRNKTDAPVESE